MAGEFFDLDGYDIAEFLRQVQKNKPMDEGGKTDR
jgi:hypothetical protein